MEEALMHLRDALQIYKSNVAPLLKAAEYHDAYTQAINALLLLENARVGLLRSDKDMYTLGTRICTMIVNLEMIRDKCLELCRGHGRDENFTFNTDAINDAVPIIEHAVNSLS